METLLIVIGLLVLVFILSFMRRVPRPTEAFMPFQLIKPKLYWFVDGDAVPNSRNWWDFHGRQSVTPNRGYLSVTLDALNRTQGKDFNIIPLIGRMQTMTYLGNAHPRAIDLPPALWRCYIIAALAVRGGLVIDGNSVLTLGPSFAPHLKDVAAAVFGCDHDEAVVNPQEALAPGPDNYVGYAAAANHPAWTYTLNEYTKLCEAGPQTWTAALARRMPRTLFETQKQKGIECIRDVDGSRLPNGQLRQLEDYFGRKYDVEDPKQAVDPKAVYVTYNGEDLERRYEFNWFLRLSHKQLEDTDLLWSKYAGLV
jgi:hypothetical protein